MIALPLLAAGLLLVMFRAAGGSAASTAVHPLVPGKKSTKPPAVPSKQPVPISNPQRVAAEALVQYVGSGARDKSAIKKLQSAMGGLKPDGVVGPLTRNRAEALLGHQVIWPPDIYDPLAEMLGKGSKPAPPAPEQDLGTLPPMVIDVPIPKSRLKAPAKSKATKSPKTKPTAAKAAESLPDAKTAARDLHEYVDGGGRDRAMVAAFQRRMALDPDGLVGPATRARVDQLIGQQSWPADAGKGVGPAPAPTSAEQAARELRAYLGSGGKRKDRVKAYQQAMGGVDADGVAGPKTKKRIAELLGE